MKKTNEEYVLTISRLKKLRDEIVAKIEEIEGRQGEEDGDRDVKGSA